MVLFSQFSSIIYPILSPDKMHHDIIIIRSHMRARARGESPVCACASELISLAYKVLTMAHVAFTIKFTVAYFERVYVCATLPYQVRWIDAMHSHPLQPFGALK